MNILINSLYNSNIQNFILPDGKYTFTRKKKSDNKIVQTTAIIKNGKWTFIKGSILGIKEDKGMPKKSKDIRAKLLLDSDGKLLNNFEIGECTPSCAGSVVMNQAIDGWEAWKNEQGQFINIYRKK